MIGQAKDLEKKGLDTDEAKSVVLTDTMRKLLLQFSESETEIERLNVNDSDQRLIYRALHKELRDNLDSMPLTSRQSINLEKARRLLAKYDADVPDENQAPKQQAILLATSAYKARKLLEKEMPLWLVVPGVLLSGGLSNALFLTTFSGMLDLTTVPESNFYKKMSLDLTIILGAVSAFLSMSANWIFTHIGTPKGLTRYLTNKKNTTERLYTPRALFSFILSGAMGWIMYDITSNRIQNLPSDLSELEGEKDSLSILECIVYVQSKIGEVDWLNDVLSFLAVAMAICTGLVYFTIDGSCNDDLIRDMSSPSGICRPRSIAKLIGAGFTIAATSWISFDGYRCAEEDGADPFWNSVKFYVSILAETLLYLKSGFIFIDNIADKLISKQETKKDGYTEFHDDHHVSYHAVDERLQPKFSWQSDLFPNTAVILNGLCNVIIFLDGLMERFKGWLVPTLISMGIFWNSATVCSMFLDKAVSREDVEAVKSRAQELCMHGVFPGPTHLDTSPNTSLAHLNDHHDSREGGDRVGMVPSLNYAGDGSAYI